MTIIDCISDLHGYYPKLEGGDLLIVAGDLTARDTGLEHLEFIKWLCDQKYRKKVFILGNHDNHTSFNEPIEDIRGFSYLCDSGTEFEGLKIWGSPWTKTFYGMNPKCKAFTVDTENELMEKFEKIPHDIDILITHSPPYSVLDKVKAGYSVGSVYLYNWLKYCGRPKFHVFGHIHEAYGEAEVFVGHNDIMVKSVNCSHVNERYQPVNKPIRIEL